MQLVQFPSAMKNSIRFRSFKSSERNLPVYEEQAHGPVRVDGNFENLGDFVFHCHAIHDRRRHHHFHVHRHELAAESLHEVADSSSYNAAAVVVVDDVDDDWNNSDDDFELNRGESFDSIVVVAAVDRLNNYVDIAVVVAAAAEMDANDFVADRCVEDRLVMFPDDVLDNSNHLI